MCKSIQKSKPLVPNIGFSCGMIGISVGLFSLGVLAFEARGEEKLAVGSVKLLSDRGSTRATRYSSANKIVTLADKTHVAWLDSVSRTMMATFDHGSGKWSAAVHVGDGFDNHGGPALTCDSKGYLHIVFGPHAESPFRHYRSAKPNDATAWVEWPRFGTYATYPSMVCDPEDTLHVIYRGGNRSRHPFQLRYQRKPMGGSWSEPVALASSPEEWKGYTHYHASLAISRSGVLQVAFDLYYDSRALLAGHLMSIDGGKIWTKADGERVALPVTPGSDAFFLRSETPLSVLNAVCDEKGRPWIGVSRQTGMTIHYFDGKDWQVFNPADRAASVPDGSKVYWGTMSFGAEDRLYVGGIEGARVKGGVTGNVFLLFSNDGGRRFDRLDLFGPDEKLPHIGVSLERFTGHHAVGAPFVLFSTGEKGPDSVGKGIFHRVHAIELRR